MFLINFYFNLGKFQFMEIHNLFLKNWVQEMESLCTPKNVYWCDGSQEEYNRLCEDMVEAGTFIRLNEEKRPNCFY